MKYPIIPLTNEQKLEVGRFNEDKKIQLKTLSCINCKSENYKILFTNDRHGINQNTVMCNKCGFVYSNPRMTEESLNYFYSSNLYRKIYEASNDMEHNFNKRNEVIGKSIEVNKPNYNKYYPNLFFDFICSLNLSYKTVCEIGAGFGNNLIFFKKYGKEVFGLEPSITLAKMAADNKMNIVQGFVDDLNNKYDMIILKHVFEHLYDPIKDLKKIYSHINKYLFIEVPGNYNRLSSIQNAHNFYFSENTLHKIVTGVGFKLISANYCRQTGFIFALYEKHGTNNNSFKYSYLKEIRKTKKIYKKEVMIYFISSIVKTLRLYKLLLPLRKIVLKILN